MKTQVAIIGAGPAGLFLGHLLRAEGIECVVIERQTGDHVLSRIRAGVLEQITVGLMARLGLDARLKSEGLVEEGFNLADGERLIRIDVANLTGKTVVVYGQTEITRDLMAAAPERGLEVIYGVEDVSLHGIEGDAPFVTWHQSGSERRLDARFIVGCDGFHGPSRKAIPAAAAREFERVYPFGWLGILADVPPCNHELIYAMFVVAITSMSL
jgi:p-hydroxybenzoate 3-monooxygenase